MYTLGIDIGSTTSKCVILKNGRDIVASSVITSGTGTDGPERAMNEVLKKSNLQACDISYITATGYGRTLFEDAHSEVSELTCHVYGVHFIFPQVRTIIDIGGQDAKVIAINEHGKMVNFLMNDKCAAGTGRFMDVMAGILQLKIWDLEGEAAKAEAPVKISNTCTVFAESEVISQLSTGANIPNLVGGICDCVAGKVAALARRIGIKEELCMSGGVAQNGGVRAAMERELGVKVVYSPLAQLMGALGAAIYAYKKADSQDGNTPASEPDL